MVQDEVRDQTRLMCVGKPWKNVYEGNVTRLEAAGWKVD